LFCQFTYIRNVIFGCLTNCYLTMATFEISVDYDAAGSAIFLAQIVIQHCKTALMSIFKLVDCDARHNAYFFHCPALFHFAINGK
ncbi:hypothetical protein T4A_14313, partial [Trichinella pseudospiralis]